MRLYLSSLLTVATVLFAAVSPAQESPVSKELEASRDLMQKCADKIDRLVKAKWTENDVTPSPPISDGIFMRRVYLDITGTIPSLQQALEFVDAKYANKRKLLIDYLLESSSDGYASHYYNYWANALRVKSNVSNIELHNYVKWIKDALRDNKPYDEFVYELLSAEGKPYDNGAVGYYLRDQGMPLDNLSNTVKIFLGTQVGCAQCHDHPFERWTQKDFYQLAAFTYGIDTRAGAKAFRSKRRAVETEIKKRKLTPQEGRLINRLARYNQAELRDAPKRLLKFPKDYQYDDVKPNSLVSPKTIFGENPDLENVQSRRQVFASWVTSKENPLFAKVIANRMWKQLMGVALIEPIDDVEGATASNPELLEFLTYAMIQLDFDLKQYLRMIMYTDVYQRRAVFREVSEEEYHYPGPTLRRMSAEQIWDSLVTLSMSDPLAKTYEQTNYYRYPYYDIESASPADIVNSGLALIKARGKPKTMISKSSSSSISTGPNLARASEMRQPASLGSFLRDFGQSDRELSDGSNTDPTVTQILTLINGKHHHQIVRTGSDLMEHLKKVGKLSTSRTRVIYLSILGREPSNDEKRLATSVFKRADSTSAGNKDLIWILLNTPEFMFIQ